MLFYDIAMQYLDKDKYNLAPLSVRTYFWNLKKIKDFKPDLTCNDLTPDLVQEYKFYLQDIGNRPATINKALSVFRIFTNKMVADGLIATNPFDKVKIGRVYTRRGFLTMREL